MSFRAPASADLTWPHAAVGSEYRVAIRNEDTGEKRTLYHGADAGCRLPSDVRRSADQWSFRVEARNVDAGEDRYRNLLMFTGIERLGDDFQTEAPDLLIAAPTKAASSYRLLVRNAETDEILVDFARPEPRFLLPPGQLGAGDTYQWQVSPLIAGRWRRTQWEPVSAAMIAAAVARAARPLPVEQAKRTAIASPSLLVPDWRPPAPVPEGEDAPGYLVAVDFGLEPALATDLDSARLLDEQWGGAGGRILSVLESHGLRGLIFVDILATVALEPTRLARVIADLSRRGHRVEPLVRGDPWRHFLAGDAATLDLSGLTALALEAFAEAAGRRAELIRFDAAHSAEDSIRAAAKAGVGALVMDGRPLAEAPHWMRGRTQPFPAAEGLVLVPVTRALSLPAHPGDRVLAHDLSAGDPYLVSELASLAAAAASLERPAPLILSASVARMIARRKVRSVSEAEAWNRAIAAERPAWEAAGLLRSPRGYFVGAGVNEIAAELLDRALSLLSAADMAPLSPGLDRLTAGRLAAWAAPRAFEPLLQIQRANATARVSMVRRYDEAFRIALMASSSAAQ